MEKLELKYYFKHLDEFSNKDIFENCTYVWELLNKINNYLKEKVVKTNIQINKAEVGEFCSITGNYFIDEGTKIGNSVTIQGPVIIGKNVEIRSWCINKTRFNN